MGRAIKPQAWRETRSKTPRTDNFTLQTPGLHLDPADFTSREALIRIATQVHLLMANWSEFARTLETELNNSVPGEWKQEKQEGVEWNSGSR